MVDAFALSVSSLFRQASDDEHSSDFLFAEL